METLMLNDYGWHFKKYIVSWKTNKSLIVVLVVAYSNFSPTSYFTSEPFACFNGNRRRQRRKQKQSACRERCENILLYLECLCSLSAHSWITFHVPAHGCTIHERLAIAHLFSFSSRDTAWRIQPGLLFSCPHIIMGHLIVGVLSMLVRHSVKQLNLDRIGF